MFAQMSNDLVLLLGPEAADRQDRAQGPSPRLYVGRLDRFDALRREAARLYAAARRGEVPAQDASRLASVLAIIGRLIELGDVEARLARLERDAPPWAA